jgi:hypothetical protein
MRQDKNQATVKTRELSLIKVACIDLKQVVKKLLPFFYVCEGILNLLSWKEYYIVHFQHLLSFLLLTRRRVG